MKKLTGLVQFIARQPRWRFGVVAAIIVGAVWLNSGGKGRRLATGFAARRGPLEITVLEVYSRNVIAFRREADLHLAGRFHIGFVSPVMGDLPGHHESSRRLPD